MTEPDPGEARPTDRSFEAFYRREFPSALHLAWSLTGRRAVAEEVCQEAFLAAYRRWPKVAGYDAPQLWLRRVLMNRCVSVFRRGTNEARYLRQRSRARAEQHVDPELPDEELWTAVRALPRRQAQAVALVYVGDLSVSQAAVAMGCTVETVRTHLRRALAALEARLAEEAAAFGRDDRERNDGGRNDGERNWPDGSEDERSDERGDRDGS